MNGINRPPLDRATFDRSVQEAHRELSARLMTDFDSKP
jgi:hypothetical protein